MALGDAALERVRRLIDERHLCRRADRLILAVSGGADSLCLLDVMARLRPGRAAVVVHVDHGFRPDSAADATAVREAAARLGLASEVLPVDGPAYARAHGLGLEHAAASAW